MKGGSFKSRVGQPGPVKKGSDFDHLGKKL